MDIDDYWSEEKLEIQIKSFKDSSVGFSFTNFWYVKNFLKSYSKIKVNLKFDEGYINKIIKKYEIVISTIMFKNLFLKKKYYV